MRHLIVGTGVAGLSAGMAIRSIQPDAEIILLSQEPEKYYSRPGLAYLLTKEIPEKQLFPLSSRELQALGLKIQAGVVRSIQPDARELTLADGTRLPYDRLLLAVGAAASMPDLPGMDLTGVVKLDTLADARQIIRWARRGRRAVVVGGGITALEIVEGLARRGMQVHYLLRKDRYWANVLDESESRLVESHLKHAGVILHTFAEVAGLVGRRGQLRGVQLQSGETLPADLAAFAIGIQPRLGLARAAGLTTDRGILVDSYMQTSAANIFAAGDVAQVYDPASGKYILDSLWSQARAQGHCAGLNMAGQATPYIKSTPFNVTRLAGITTTLIGTVGGGQDADLIGIARGDSELWRDLPHAIACQTHKDTNRVRVMVGEHTLVGAVVMGDQALSQPLQDLITHQVDIAGIRPDLLGANGNLSALLLDFWSDWRNRYAAS